MRDVLIVMRREIATMLRRSSFYVAALVAPLTIAAIVFGFAFLNAEFGDTTPAGAARAKPTGYVDRAGVVRGVPRELGAHFVAYATEEQARVALQAGTIASYFVVAPDYRATGRVVRVSPQVTFTSGSAPDTRAFETLLRASLAGDAQLARRLDQPLDLQMHVGGGRTGEARPPRPGLNQGISFALAMLLAFSIVNGGGWLVQAIAGEKENRTIEIILTSIHPWKLLAGKLLGLGAVSLLQLGVWIALGRALTGGGAPGAARSLGSADPAVWSWMIVFFLLGFLFVGAIMTMLGAVGASIRESGQISGLITLPIIAPVWFAARDLACVAPAVAVARSGMRLAVSRGLSGSGGSDHEARRQDRAGNRGRQRDRTGDRHHLRARRRRRGGALRP